MPAGIYRDVALRVVPDPFIADVFASPANALSASPSVTVQVTIEAATAPSAPVTVTAALLDGSTQLGSATTTVTIGQPGAVTATLTLESFGAVNLWSPENPALYQVLATITAGSVTDAEQVNIGFREAVFQVDGFYLNGQHYEIFGLNRHQLFPYTGMAAAARLQRRDAELLKNELNCNM